MNLLTINVRLILKAFGYTIAILGGALTLAIIVLTTTANQDLCSYSFWGGAFLGILAVFTDELKHREALIMQLSQEEPASAALSSTPVQALRTTEDHQICTHTIIDFTRDTFSVHVARCTDGRRTPHASSRSVQPDVPHHAGAMRGARER